MYREVCSAIVSCSFRCQMEGTPEVPIQMDAARFTGRRKHNHKKNDVGPGSGAHTQDRKIMVGCQNQYAQKKKKKKGVPATMLQSHLDHFCWKVWQKDSDDSFFFLFFLQDIRRVYRDCFEIYLF